MSIPESLFEPSPGAADLTRQFIEHHLELFRALKMEARLPESGGEATPPSSNNSQVKSSPCLPPRAYFSQALT